MRYDLIEQALVQLISPLTIFETTEIAHEGYCRQYAGEFDVPSQSPEDYKPGKRYVFVDCRGTTPTKITPAGGMLRTSTDIAVFVGSNTSTRLSAKNEVFAMLDTIQDNVHNKVLIYTPKVGEPIKIGQLSWKADQKEFGTDNHICFSVTLSLATTISINNG